MTVTICITNQKGGVAKTTTAIHLAHGLALLGKRVLIVDFDPQGQASTALNLTPEPGVYYLLLTGQANIRETGRPNLQILPGDASTGTAQIVLNSENRPFKVIHEVLKRFTHEYDYLVLDTAPSIGGIQERALFASNLILIPTSTEFLAADGLGKSLTLLSTMRNEHEWKGKLFGILPTFHDVTTTAARETFEDLQTNYANYLLPPIHRATFLRDCAAEGRTAFEVNPGHRAAKEYATLVELLVQRQP